VSERERDIYRVTLSVAIPNEKRVLVKRNIITNRASAVRVTDSDRVRGGGVIKNE